MSAVLPKGGLPGYVPFIFPGDRWTIHLSSGNGALALGQIQTMTPVFDVTQTKYYGDEYDMDDARAHRLINLCDDLDVCRLRRQNVVLHCSHGRSRSVICLGVYVMRKSPPLNGRYDHQHALETLKAAFLVAGSEGIAHYHALGQRVPQALLAFSNLILPPN